MPKVGKLVFLCVFIAGCVAGVVSREVFSVPKANAQTHERWDYFCFQEPDAREGKVGAMLKTAGAEGWELAAAATPSWANGGQSNPTWCMKRRLQ